MSLGMYQKEEVMPYMKGMWQDALQSICGLDSSYFGKKHGPCPVCGGRDRFRWTDKVGREAGDGGAYCNQCGGGDGILWLQRLTGESYSECINILGRFLGKQPQEYVVKKNKIASRAPDYDFVKKRDPEKCLSVMERTQILPVTRYGAFCGITTESQGFDVGVREDGYQVHSVPCFMVREDGLDSEPCNVMFVGECGEVRFLAGTSTYGSAIRVGQSEKAIYLTESWEDAHHVNIATGQECWCCFDAPGIEAVAFRYSGDRELRVACRADDLHALCAAEERDMKVIVPNGDTFKKGARRKLYSASELLNS